MNKVDVCKRGQVWVCYQTTATVAIEIFRGSLDECRDWAEVAGFDGVIFGTPSRPWAT